LVLGEGRIDIQKQLVREQGKFDKTSLVLDVKVSLKLDYQKNTKQTKLFNISGINREK
jgi:hypothetical protein